AVRGVHVTGVQTVALPVSLTVTPERLSVPEPANVAPEPKLRSPPLTPKVRPLAMDSVPVLVKEGVVPDWLRVRLALETLMVPALVWAAEAPLMVRSRSEEHTSELQSRGWVVCTRVLVKTLAEVMVPELVRE